ncbi:MAG: immunoglobulin domain-containing protein [Fibrobacter sp.]|nr:immunoglobulin domain-containing protein [Fibrobacter sp.]
MLQTLSLLQLFLLSATLAELPVQITFEPPQTINIIEGDSLRLRCIAQSTGPILYRWLKDGIEVESGSVLFIRQLKAVHQGCYICIAETENESDTSRICRVNVKRKKEDKKPMCLVPKSVQRIDSISKPDTLRDSSEAESAKFILPELFYGKHLGADSSRLVFQILPQKADSIYIWFGVDSNPSFRDSIYCKILDPGFFYSESDSDTITLTLRDSIFLIADTIYAAQTLSSGSSFSDTIFTSFSCRNSGSTVRLNNNCSKPVVKDVKILNDSGEICIVVDPCSSRVSNLFALFEPVEGSRISSIYSIAPGQDSVRLKLSSFIPAATYNVSIIREGSTGFPAQGANEGIFTLKFPENPDLVQPPEKSPEILKVYFRYNSVIFVNSLSCSNPQQVTYSIVDTHGNTIWGRTEFSGTKISETLIWDGFSDKYTPVPAGFYIFRIEVTENENSKARVGIRQFWFNPIHGNNLKLNVQ